MGNLVLDGSLTLGPATQSDGAFPAATVNEPLFSTPNPKLFNAATGIVPRQLNSPGSYQALSGAGATDTVAKGDTLYFKTNAPILVRATFADPGGGGDIVSIVPVYGTVLIELNPLGYLKLLEAKGVATIVYMVAGQS